MFNSRGIQSKPREHRSIPCNRRFRRIGRGSAVLEQGEQVVQKNDVVALEVFHGATDTGEAFAEAQVVGGAVFGRFAGGPVPVAAVLNVHDVDGVVVDDGSAGLQTDVVDATDAFFEHLRGHD